MTHPAPPFSAARPGLIAALALAAGLTTAASAQTFYTLPATPQGAFIGLQLSASGNRGVLPYFQSWQAPTTFLPITTLLALNCSPDGQYVLGTQSGVAIRYNTANQSSLGLPDNGFGSNLYAVASSADNSVIVGYGSNDFTATGMRWTSNGAGTFDAVFMPNMQTVTDCSADGQVAVGYGAGSGWYGAARWTSDGGAQPLVPDSNGLFANAISADGATIVGGLGDLGTAYRWTAPTGARYLYGPANLPPHATNAYDVSADGVRTAGMGIDLTNGVRRAMLWDGTGVPDFLAAALTRAGNTAHLPYKLLTVDSLSADGRTLSGRCLPADAPGNEGQYIVYIATLPAVCRPDVGVQGGTPGHDGHLDNNDFVVFIDSFFNHDPIADFGRQGGLPGADALFDNNDFVVFIGAFFTGCP